jgi:release factor glutamine methyltransferase
MASLLETRGVAAANSVAEVLQAAARELRQRSESPRLDAELLLGKVLGLTRAALIVRAADPVIPEQRRAYAALLAQRAGGSPVAYLTGTREFWSLPFNVTPDVLVPRPETERLVELALERLPPRSTDAILDLGTGSGAIALALAYERPQARITAVDLSAAALRVARGNAEALGRSAIDWRLGSWFDAVPGERFAMIVANPPYVAAADPALATLAAEPALALCPGPTGLEALAAIVTQGASHLENGGWLLLEHGDSQGPQVAALLARHGFTAITSHTDYSGKPRVTLGTVYSQHQEQP